jgi:hypothetical protein
MIDGIWPAWSGTRPVCAGCGHTVPAFSRLTALDAIDDLTERLTKLSTAVADSRDRKLVPWTAATKRLSHTLAALNSHLEELSALGGSSDRHQLPTSTADPCEGLAQLRWNITTLNDLSWLWPNRVDDPAPQNSPGSPSTAFSTN